MLGQPLATEALEFALTNDTPGYNVFATGVPGVGKRSVLEAELRRRAAARPSPCDWVYLRNLADPRSPIAVSLPGGRGPALAADVSARVEDIRGHIAAALEAESYRAQRGAIQERLERDRRDAVAALRALAAERGVGVELTPTGIMNVPLVDGRAMSPADFLALDEGRRSRHYAALSASRSRSRAPSRGS